MFGFVASPKVKMINVRLTPEIHDAFKIACDLRGVSMSSFMHQTIVKVIREEKEREPQAFKRPEQTQGKTKVGVLTLPNSVREKRKTG